MDKDYIKMYKILDYCFNNMRDVLEKNSEKTEYTEYDYLAVLLGALSLDVFSDDLPADPAIQEEWDTVALRCSDVLDKILAFLDMYEKDFGFDFKIIISFLLHVKEMKKLLESE